MKRHGIALLIHPYKNGLVEKNALRDMFDVFAQRLLDITSAHPNLRINLVLPGYLLQLLNPLLLSKLNEIQKRDCLEWLSPGFTEPFFSFSPFWLSKENIQYGLETFQELIGARPTGYVPPFSNWEPASIDTLKNNGINYTILSHALLPNIYQNYCGYWITEQSGNSMPIIPVHDVHYYNAPANILGWFDKTLEDSPDTHDIKLIALKYLVPIVPQKNIDPYKWIESFADALNTLLVKYQLNLLKEFPTLTPPVGLQEIEPGLMFNNNGIDRLNSISNFLHTFDSVGIMQRKMMDIAEKIKKINNNKDSLPLKRKLFFVQDINRYLPNDNSGFHHIKDRCWTFNQMIDIERQILKKDTLTGGQIRIADLLKNGTKSIVLSNKSMQVYIDHKNGGQIFELDFRDRNANICAGHNPKPRTPPKIICAGKSRTAFIDHFLDENCQRTDFISQITKERGDFATGSFDYKVKKTATSIKAILTRQGSITANEKTYPLTVEKVFALEKDVSDIYFAYKLSNHSLTSYGFKFAIEMTFALPGAKTHQVEFISGKTTYNRLAWDRITLENHTKWSIIDNLIGVRLDFITQKPVTIWCYPLTQSSPYQGTSLIITAPVSLNENDSWSLMGKISCKKLRTKGVYTDAV